MHELIGDRACALECGPDKPCYLDTCCARTNVPVNVPVNVNSQEFRHSLKRSASNQDISDNNSVTSPDSGHFTDIFGTFGSLKRQTKPTQQASEAHANGVVEMMEESTA